MTRELAETFFKEQEGGTSVSLVPESTFNRSTEDLVEAVRAVADRAVESVKPLLESETSAQLAFAEDSCLRTSSSFLLTSSFFFCRHADTS